MERKPIIQPQYDIILSKEKPSIQDLIPKYRYEFQNLIINNESTNMYEDLIEFLKTNEYLAIEESGLTEDYIKGFKKSLALVRLWLDSLYLENN